MIITEIKALLDLFEENVPDRESNRLVRRYSDEKQKWSKAHGLFTTIRERNLAAVKKCGAVRECQYCHAWSNKLHALTIEADFERARSAASSIFERT